MLDNNFSQRYKVICQQFVSPPTESNFFLGGAGEMCFLLSVNVSFNQEDVPTLRTITFVLRLTHNRPNRNHTADYRRGGTALKSVAATL